MNEKVWLVGAAYSGNDDQTQRFLSEGIWENGYKDKYLEQVLEMQPGERIAIKASYTKKHGLPFDNRGHSVSVMAIKATGVITENLGDGRKVRVEWTPVVPPRIWYFFTNQQTVWRVQPGHWMHETLVRFVFDGEEQDIDRFRNAPFWKERFGDLTPQVKHFTWTPFYEELADKLLLFKNNRPALVQALQEISRKVSGVSSLQDQYADGTAGPLRDIDPFTTIGVFNRQIKNTNRMAISEELKRLLKIEVPIPDRFDGVPILNNMNSWFFGYEKEREADHIESLWNVLEAAINFADTDSSDAREAFQQAFDAANGKYGVGWNLTCALYWIRPWKFLPLDSRSQEYLRNKLGVAIPCNGPKDRCNSTDYLQLMEHLEQRFQEQEYPVHTFPELSLAAWIGEQPVVDPKPIPDPDETGKGDEVVPVVAAAPYSLDSIISDGCFLSKEKLQRILQSLEAKRNIILQGPPGTGKTWLAKRIAFALLGRRDESKVRSVQFHPNLSYEDFIRGWRPSGDGRLSLCDGPFLETINASLHDPNVKHVMVIEEINRGNPAHIFGEMLTLLEADKRTPAAALELSYRREPGERVHVPSNLYVIGTMNIADRSLALVDLALRRRFAFVNLEPELGPTWRQWVVLQHKLEQDAVNQIEARMTRLNEKISNEPGLGRQFCIGHSYVTPANGHEIKDTRVWFRNVVETEIGPLLDEYWFDNKSKADEARALLLEAL